MKVDNADYDIGGNNTIFVKKTASWACYSKKYL